MGLHIASVLWDLLHEADGIEFRCSGCGRRTYFPFRMLVEIVRPSTKLTDVLPRLRCKSCGSRGVPFLGVSLWKASEASENMGLKASKD